jgi:hypothetical protein
MLARGPRVPAAANGGQAAVNAPLVASRAGSRALGAAPRRCPRPPRVAAPEQPLAQAPHPQRQQQHPHHTQQQQQLGGLPSLGRPSPAALLQEIVAPVAADMDALAAGLRDTVGDRHPVLRAAAEQIFGAGGKRLRPMIVLLMARATAEMGGLRCAPQAGGARGGGEGPRPRALERPRAPRQRAAPRPARRPRRALSHAGRAARMHAPHGSAAGGAKHLASPRRRRGARPVPSPARRGPPPPHPPPPLRRRRAAAAARPLRRP